MLIVELNVMARCHFSFLIEFFTYKVRYKKHGDTEKKMKAEG
jgi:hypothetical protein